LTLGWERVEHEQALNTAGDDVVYTGGATSSMTTAPPVNSAVFTATSGGDGQDMDASRLFGLHYDPMAVSISDDDHHSVRAINASRSLARVALVSWSSCQARSLIRDSFGL